MSEGEIISNSALLIIAGSETSKSPKLSRPIAYFLSRQND